MSKACGFPDKIYRVRCAWVIYTFAPSAEDAADCGASSIEMWLADMGTLDFEVEEVAFDGEDHTSIHQGECKIVEGESFIAALEKSAEEDTSRNVLLGEMLAAAEKAVDRDDAIKLLTVALRIMKRSKRQWLRTQIREERVAGETPQRVATAGNAPALMNSETTTDTK